MPNSAESPPTSDHSANSPDHPPTGPRSWNIPPVAGLACMPVFMPLKPTCLRDLVRPSVVGVALFRNKSSRPLLCWLGRRFFQAGFEATRGPPGATLPVPGGPLGYGTNPYHQDCLRGPSSGRQRLRPEWIPTRPHSTARRTVTFAAAIVSASASSSLSSGSILWVRHLSQW